MEAILEFIFGNIFIIVLLIGGIISAINRNKQGQEKSERDTDNKRGTQRKIDWETIFQEKKPDKQPEEHPTGRVPYPVNDTTEHKTTELNTEQTSYQEKREQIKEQEKEAKVLIEKVGTSSVLEEEIGTSENEMPIKEKRQVSASRFSSISKKDARNGVIWAEVLGKPKSQQHHNRYIGNRVYYRNYRRKS